MLHAYCWIIGGSARTKTDNGAVVSVVKEKAAEVLGHPFSFATTNTQTAGCIRTFSVKGKESNFITVDGKLDIWMTKQYAQIFSGN